MLPGIVDIQKLEVRRQCCVIGPANNSISKCTPASKSAYGISLYVSDDPQGSNVCNTMVRRVPWPGGATGKSAKPQAASNA